MIFTFLSFLLFGHIEEGRYAREAEEKNEEAEQISLTETSENDEPQGKYVLLIKILS